MEQSNTDIIIAIDPGTTETGYVIWDPKIEKVLSFGKIVNEELFKTIRDYMSEFNLSCKTKVYIEMIASYGMPVGKEVFETCVFIGRIAETFADYYGTDIFLVFRRNVKLWHCHSSKANDATINIALQDKYGKPGTKKEPGIMYGIVKDIKAAFAIATYISEAAEPQVTPLTKFNYD